MPKKREENPIIRYHTIERKMKNYLEGRSMGRIPSSPAVAAATVSLGAASIPCTLLITILAISILVSCTVLRASFVCISVLATVLVAVLRLPCPGASTISIAVYLAAITCIRILYWTILSLR
jgi:hypothetical protein